MTGSPCRFAGGGGAVYGVTHTMSLDGPCPGCKHSLAAHPRSAPSARDLADGIDLVRGRCIVAGERAPQKLCWVLLVGPLTVGEYLDAYEDTAPPRPPCPACGGVTVLHGSYWRLVAEDPVRPTLVRLYRVLCKEPGCPVVTVTLYPPFVTPYMPFPTAVREQAMRDHDGGSASWRHLAQAIGVTLDTLRRWARQLRARAASLRAGFLSILVDTDIQFRLPRARDGPSLWVLADAAAAAVGRSQWPRLAVARLALDVGPLPVWA
jgi:hypothetical protein